ncbi:Transcriptional regulator, AcrR family [hydrothermal vent metagenome]|uniref:Transcriptional regulator, AcrR family n=1 Tax=hydrothermal vent metagenome TaxID=652676 RepID=A0A3B0TVG6_9ZZZZ
MAAKDQHNPDKQAKAPSKKQNPKSGRKFRRRAEARPDEVLDAALDLFIEKGFAATRVEDIAKKAGISKGSVYLYFSSKQALIEGLVKRAISPMAANAIMMATRFEGDPRTLITLILNMIAARFEDGQLLAIPKLIMREAPAFPEIAVMYRDQVLKTALPVFEDIIKKGVTAGYFRKVDPELTIRSIMGPIITHLMLAEIFAIKPSDGLAMDRLIENHLTILFDGLSMPKGAPQ